MLLEFRSIIVYALIVLVGINGFLGNLTFIYLILPYSLIFFSVWKSFRSGFVPAKLFIIGVASILVGFIVYFLMELNIVGANSFTVYALYFAMVIEIFVFTIAMGVRFKHVEKEKNDTIFKFQNQLKKIAQDENNIINEFKEKFKEESDTLWVKYNKAKQELLLTQRELEQLSETKGQLVLEGNVADQRFMESLITLIEQNINNEHLDREFICKELGMSKSVLYRKLNDMQGTSINNFIRTIRLRAALKLLKNGELTISEVAFETGFNSLSYFTRSFKNEYNYNPSEIKPNGIG